ncbi:MAG TPA: hypothetical protein VEP29_00745, partial [Desulfatiglandales bacterium]|nr:hypothetical protein [Desulfatiglandales bacterium]
EKVALTEGMARPEKEKMLLEEVAKFKKLKEQVMLRKAEKKEVVVAEVAPPPAPPEEKRAPVTESSPQEEQKTEPAPEARFTGLSPHEAFAYALEEIKDVIRAEFRALRAEIKLWRESK